MSNAAKILGACRLSVLISSLVFCGFCGNGGAAGVTANPAAGDVDEDFLLQLGSGFDGPVDSIALQSSGKIIVGGRFTHVNGVAQPYLARLSTNGALDTTFASGMKLNNSVSEVIVGRRDAVFVAGAFNSYSLGSLSVLAPHLLKLSASGEVDADFLANLFSGFDTNTNALALDSSGALYVGGSFALFNNLPRSKLLKLNADGTEDSTFGAAMASGFNSAVTSIAIRGDDQPCVAGSFTQFKSASVYRLACLTSAGELLAEFNGLLGNVFNNTLLAIVGGGSSDYGIYAGGLNQSFSETSNGYYAYISSDGRYESTLTYNAEGGPDKDVHELTFDQFGNLLAGGDFCKWGSQTTCGLARTASGVLDTSFSTHLGTGFVGAVRSVREQLDGRLLVGGEFSQLNGRALSTHLLRLK